jgi:beta-lactam-binding protein with PASTA domain
MHFSAARNALNDLHLDLEIILEDPVSSDEVERNNVIQTIPSHGAPLSRGDTVVITYSAGPDIRTEIVPDLVGSQLSVVESAFAGLEITPLVEEREDQAEAGTVIFIQHVGQEIIVPAEVRVIVSTGPPERTEIVPNMLGSQQSALEVRFANLQLTPIFSFREDPAPVGTVIEIELMDQTIPVPANINVVISSGPPPQPPQPPQPPTNGGGNGNGGGVAPG